MNTMREGTSRSEMARQALAELCHGFMPGVEALTGCAHVEPDEMPDPFSRLLIHNDHMTTRLAEFLGRAVELRVIHQQSSGESYRRFITLSPAGSDRVVEVGLVRIDLACTTPAVRDMILEAQRPLGDILITHDVLRRIEPRWYFRFDGTSTLLGYFGEPLKVAYGRMGVIHCDGKPAIQLLEVVSGAE